MSGGNWGQPKCTDHVFKSPPRSRLDPSAGIAHPADEMGPPALAIVVMVHTLPPSDRTRCERVCVLSIPATLSRYVNQITPL